MKIYGDYNRIDLTVGMRNKDRPDGPDGQRGWSAGEQMEALKFYAPEDFVLLKDFWAGSYQGDIYGIAYLRGSEPRFIFFHDSYGSCSGCDALEDSDGYEYVRGVLENNTWQFLTLNDMVKYLEEKDIRGCGWYGYDNIKDDILEWCRDRLSKNGCAPSDESQKQSDAVISAVGHRGQR